MTSVTIFLLWFLYPVIVTSVNFYTEKTTVSCIESEKQALLTFKQDVIDHANRLASWSGDGDEDCCKWVGVVCDNVTGHVLELHLQNPSYDHANDAENSEGNDWSRLGGKINPSLLNLKHLIYLDLSNNAFRGMVPYQLGNISNLEHLNLSHNLDKLLYIENLQWLVGFPRLKYLDLSNVNIGKAFDWLQKINIVTSLKELYLSSCELPRVIPQLPKFNLSSLSILDVSGNNFESISMINWVFSLNTLISLDLGHNNFHGPIPDGLRNMTSLRHLDFSGSFFISSIPDWFYGFSPLEILDLHNSSLQGKISHDIGNMTSAISLDLSENELEGEIPRSIGSLCKLRSLSFDGVNLNQKISDIIEILSGCISNGLESLNLGGCQLFGQLTNQLQVFKNIIELGLRHNSISGLIPTSIGKLSSLRSIDLSYNLLEGFASETSIGGLSSIRFVYLSNNKLEGNLPESFWQLANLELLDISHNLLKGINVSKASMGHLSSLKLVYLSNNKLQGEIPTSFWQFPCLELLDVSVNLLEGFASNTSITQPSSLRVVYLARNKLKGNIPKFIWQLENLELLDISRNLLEGVVEETYLSNLTKLRDFYGSGNPLTLKMNPNQIPTFQFESLGLGSWHLGPHFPGWLHSQKHLSYLDISNSEISDSIPCWFGNFSSQFNYLYLTQNQISGQIPHFPIVSDDAIFDFSSNNFSGPLPLISSNLTGLDLSDNSLSGSLSHFLCHRLNESMRLSFLNLGKNFLFGEIPNCWMKWKILAVIKLDNNRFVGGIPSSWGALPSLQSLHLKSNNFFGEIPLSLRNCTELVTLDFADNEFGGKIPTWLGDSLPHLIVLNLRSNKFRSSIPDELCDLDRLQILDLANNHLSGSLPKCLSNFSAMSR
ncbi:hypothetical protein CRYUN_Cryun36dG0012300 [Craigia yunnanensis]